MYSKLFLCRLQFIVTNAIACKHAQWKTFCAQTLKACSWPLNSSPVVTCTNRSPPNSPIKLSMYLPKAQKYGYALEPNANTANLSSKRLVGMHWPLRNDRRFSAKLPLQYEWTCFVFLKKKRRQRGAHLNLEAKRCGTLSTASKIMERDWCALNNVCYVIATLPHSNNDHLIFYYFFYIQLTWPRFRPINDSLKCLKLKNFFLGIASGQHLS